MTKLKLTILVGFCCIAACRCDANNDNNEPDGGPTATDADGADAELDAGEDGGVEPASCGDDGILEQTIGDWTLRLYADDGHWELEAGDGTTLRSPAACEQAAVRVGEGSPLERSDFANFRFDFENLVEWTPNFSEVPEWIPSGDGVLLRYYTGARPESPGENDTSLADNIDVTFYQNDEGDLRIDMVAEGSKTSGELRFDCQPAEAFFGLGTQVTGMNLRGRSYPLWTQEQGNSKNEEGFPYPLANTLEAAYAPMGVWHSTRGYSAIVGHDSLTELDLCESDETVTAVRSHHFLPSFVLFTGTPKERMTTVADYVGRVRNDIPDWTFGLWVDAVTGPERIDTVANALRDNDIPASAIWTEDWIGGSSGPFGYRLSYDWIWDDELYPSLPTTVDDLQAEGFAFLTYFNSFLPRDTSIYPEAIEGGFAVTDDDGEVVTFQDPGFRTAALADLFNPETREWLAEYQRAAVIDIGADGWMADFAEWYPAEGIDFWERHNIYPLIWQAENANNLAAAKAEIGDEGNWVFFARSGWASVNGGTAGLAPTLWGGDQNTTWGYDDGFPTIIPIGAHVGLAGVAIFGSDIAGYNSQTNLPPTDKELWFRWASAGAFHPLMRTHHGGNECENWNFDRDQETLDHMKRWSTVHSLLFPEFQRLYRQAVAQGWPITRHPWLVEPDASELWTGDQYQWFLGDDIVIAPVLEQGATVRDVTLPGAGWWPLFGDAAAGSAAIAVDSAVTEIPVYVRPGRALTLLADAPDSFYGSEDVNVTDLEDVENRYRVALYPNSEGAASSAGETPFAVGGRGLAAFEPSAATFNNVALPSCRPNASESCYTANTVLLVGVTAGSLTMGSATVDVDAPGPIDVEIGVGGAAWGSVAEPTTFAPNPDAPTWCPEE